MPLATTVLRANHATPTRSMLFLHGLLGARTNWRGLARRFVDGRPDWQAVLVDLREHGESLGLAGEPTVEQCALDLLGLELDVPVRGALGHSFGGKVAMRWAALTPGEVDELWIIDSTPSRRPTGAGEARRVLDLLKEARRSHPDGFASREAFAAFITEHGETRGIADWLAMNLVALPGGRRGLRLDLDRITALLDDYGDVDAWACFEPTPRIHEVHMVIGGRSPVVDAADRAKLEAMSDSNHHLHVHTFDDAGHWVHVDAPGPLLTTLLKLY